MPASRPAHTAREPDRPPDVAASDPTTDPALRSWVPDADESGFPIQHLPYGVFSDERPPRIGVAIGSRVLDLAVVADARLFGDVVPEARRWFAADRLNPLLEAGPDLWDAVRARVSTLLEAGADPRPPRTALRPIDQVRLHLPFTPGDFVDFSSSLDHATNIGRIFRPDEEPLMPNWRHLPVAYHGRAGTVVASGTPIPRPRGQRSPEAPDRPPRFGPSQRLDIELEIGFVTGSGPDLGAAIPINEAERLIFGVVLVNDWSARDIQAWEYRPLGPFLGKSFATSVAHWVTPLTALRPYKLRGVPQRPQPLEYLRDSEPRSYDITLEVRLRSSRMRAAGRPPDAISRTTFARMYWSMAQQLAHATVNGARVRAGDLYASGTVSGPVKGSEGSLIELTRDGREPLTLADGSTRTFLEDGDEVVLAGWCEREGHRRIELGTVRGRVKPPG